MVDRSPCNCCIVPTPVVIEVNFNLDVNVMLILCLISCQRMSVFCVLNLMHRSNEVL